MSRLRMEAEGAGRVPAGRASFWPGDPSCLQEPSDSGGWRGLRGTRCQQPPARAEHLHIRVFRDQLCTSAILKSSDIFHGDREVVRRGGNREVSAPCLCRSTRRGEEAGGCEEAAMKLIPIDNKKNHHHPQQESRVHPPRQRLGVGWAFLLLAPSVAMNPPQAVHTRTPFPSTKRRGRNKRDPQPRHTQQTPQMLKVCGFCNPIFTPSPPE